MTTGCSHIKGTGHLSKTRLSDTEGQMFDRSGFKSFDIFAVKGAKKQMRRGTKKRENNSMFLC